MFLETCNGEHFLHEMKERCKVTYVKTFFGRFIRNSVFI